MNRIRVAIDGPSGVGKSTAARMLADKLGLQYVDTGAMYRAVGVLARRHGLQLEDDLAVSRFVESLSFSFPVVDGQPHTVVDGEDLTDVIRTARASMDASTVSKLPTVRAALVALQRGLAEKGGVVMEGRDIGTVVMPDADIKFFLDADVGERGRRRHLELVVRGEDVEIQAVVDAVEQRDRQDRTRRASPLRPADDAVVIDTTELDAEEVADHLEKLAHRAAKAF